MNTHQQNEEALQDMQRRTDITPLVSFAIDPESGHLYISSVASALKLRDTGEGTIGPSDDTAAAPGRMAFAGGHIFAYGAV